MADEYRNLHQAVSVRLLLPGSLNCLVPLATMLCRTSFWHYRHYHNPLDLVPWRIFRPNSSSLTFRMQVFFAFFVIPRKSASQKIRTARRHIMRSRSAGDFFTPCGRREVD